MPKPKNPFAAARKHLSDAQLIAFVRAAAKEDHSRAAMIFRKELDKGRTLDEIAAMFSGEREGSLDLDLKVKRKREGEYEITCGLHGGHVGDGGSYLVRYGAKGKLLSVEQTGFWIC